MRMRFATRAFLWSFVPIGILLALSFWVIQRRVQDTVRETLRSSLSQEQETISHLRQQGELQNSRMLRIVAENPPLKAGLQLLLASPRSAAARLTVEDQLRQIASMLQFDFMLISNADGKPLVGVVRIDEQLVGVDISHISSPQQGLFVWDGSTFQVNSFSINVNDENIGVLSIGEHFEISDFGTPAILARKGKVLRSTVPHAALPEVERALQSCGEKGECEIRVGGAAYLTLASGDLEFNDGYTLRFLQSISSFSVPVQRVLQRVFLTAGTGALLAAALLSMFSSRSIVRPIAAVVSRLREGEHTGMLPAFHEAPASIQEIRELTDSFNQAAAAVHESRENLQQAYVEFVGSLASSLDARDDYTAGHSHRVSEYSCIIGHAMRIPAEELQVLRIGALLHDIGKIGVPDNVLNKPGRLTAEEFALLRQHPCIGRRILEGVRGFQPYLPIVELHHENWDGSGYPLRLAGTQVPLLARIVHVADAYDAMTSARPYREALGHEFAMHELENFAGTQFDPEVVRTFVHSMRMPDVANSPDMPSSPDLDYISASSDQRGAETETV